MKIDIPKGASFIISRLEENGKRADIVGGCVRDALLGKSADDFDITTSATPDEVVRIFSDFKVIKTGIAHGTVTVLVDGVPYEVTTYRIDGKYTDNRHPDSVTFTQDIKDDLARRDFTVNAMAYSKTYGLTDVFGGRNDLKAHKIRAVGCPKERFSEDALRILRAIRFASVLNFEIEENTAHQAKELAPSLKGVSEERIYTEWRKLLGGASAYAVISEFPEVIGEFLPEILPLSLPRRELFDSASPLVKMLSLFAKNRKDDASDAFYRAACRLKTDKKVRDNGKCALEFYKNQTECERDLLKLLADVGKECARLTLELKIALGLAPSDVLSALSLVIEKGLPYKPSDLEIGGEELRALGFIGKEIGAMLSELLSLVIEGIIPNESDTLLLYAKERKTANNP